MTRWRKVLLILGIASTAFGVWAIVRSASLFFLIFVVPGLMLIASAWPNERVKDETTGTDRINPRQPNVT